MRGLVDVSWRVEGGLFHLDLTVPGNATAKVHVPTKAADRIREGSNAAERAPGVTRLSVSEDEAVYEVAPGRYRFVSPLE